MHLSLDLREMAEPSLQPESNSQSVKDEGELDLPKILVSAKLDPPVLSLSNKAASNLVLALISTHEKPITFFGDDVSPKVMLLYAAFKKFRPKHQRICFQPWAHLLQNTPAHKSSSAMREHLFHTLMPNTPLGSSAPFAPNIKRLIKSHSDTDPHPPPHSSMHGLAALPPGQWYLLVIDESTRIRWNYVRWWDYGTKDEVLNPGGKKLDGRKVAHSLGPHPAIEINPNL